MVCKPGFVLTPKGGDNHSSRRRVATPLKRPTRTTGAETALSMLASSLFGLAPGGVYHAALVTKRAVRSYRTLSSLPVITPEHVWRSIGGLLSVALSLRSPSPGVTRHRVSVEPGLSSPNIA